MSVMPEAMYKSSYGTLSKSDRELVGAGDVPLVTLGCAVMILTLDETAIEERVYVVRGESKLLLGIPAIRSLGLIHKIPGTFSVKSVQQTLVVLLPFRTQQQPTLRISNCNKCNECNSFSHTYFA